MRLLLALGLAVFTYVYVIRDNAINLNLKNSGPIDGTVWQVRIKPNSWFSFSHKDTLVFDAGRVSAVGFMASGFSSGGYSAAGGRERCSWQASLQKPDNESLEWSGHVREDMIEGDILRHEADGHVRRLHFKGFRQTS